MKNVDGTFIDYAQFFFSQQEIRRKGKCCPLQRTPLTLSTGKIKFVVNCNEITVYELGFCVRFVAARSF